MVLYNTILKVIEDELNKCSPKSEALENYDPNDYPNTQEEINELGLMQSELQLSDKYAQRYTQRDNTFLHYYGKSGYININKRLNEPQLWKEKYEKMFDDEEYFNQITEGIDNIIEKSPPIQENTTLFRGGKFPPNMKVGDHGVFKSFTSTSYSQKVAERFDNDEKYLIKIRVPKGTKGVFLNPNQFDVMSFESEMLLGRNQKYTVLDIDNENKEVEILLYD